MKRLKIYTEKSWLPPGKKQVILLYPFWGEVPLQPGDPDTGRFDQYMQRGNELFELTVHLKDADIAVLPFEYAIDQESIHAANRAAEEAAKFKKKLLVFYNSDFMSEINIPGSVILRTSFYKSTKKMNEFAFPGWSVDFVQKYAKGVFSALPKADPEVSYCGYIDSLEEPAAGLFEKIKNSFKGSAKDMYQIGPALRGKAVRLLDKDKRIKTRFLIRDGFWAQGMDDKNEARKQYAGNMLSSPYALVARGAGNFSYRLYEVLSCGRIPVFINTDCVLPFDQLIDWKKHVLWIEEKECDAIAARILDFHEKITENEFVNLQESNRKLYEEWISPVGFFGNLYKLLS